MCIVARFLLYSNFGSYLEDLLPLIQYRPRIKESYKNSPDDIENSDSVAIRTITRSDNINYEVSLYTLSFVHLIPS